MKALPVCLLLSLLVWVPARGQTHTCRSLKIPPREGRVVFLGDSITWQNLYTGYIEHYFRRHFPDRKLLFFNRGVRGDTASAAIERLERDVVALRPDLVVIFFGMNDGGYRGFNAFLLKYFLVFLEELVDRIQDKTGASVLLLTPTPVDPVDYNKRRYNRMLASMAEGVEDLAAQRKLPLVDLHGILVDAQKRAAAMTPPVRLMLDPIHPGPSGHMIMAQAVLGCLDARGAGRIAKKVIDLKEAEWKDGTVRLTLEHDHHNVHLPAAGAGAYRLIPDRNWPSPYLLIVRGIQGRYRLKIGDTILGTFDGDQLAAGIDLNRLDDTPWAREASRVYRLMMDRWRYQYFLWDPQDLGRDAWIKRQPSDRPPTSAQAKESLQGIEKEIQSLTRTSPVSYSLELERVF